MTTRGVSAQRAAGDLLARIKTLAVVAMFADDDLMDLLVLKGGNAMDIVHRVNARASVDLDFSVEDDLNADDLLPRISASLEKTFRQEGYQAFDIRMTARPGKMPDDLASFWGGYLVEFKLIALARAEELGDLERMRREAIELGQGSKFTIDISRHEYIENKQEAELLGYRIYVYSPAMIICEKLRAICQQMPEYAKIIKRQNSRKQRARDFIDIEALVKHFNVDVGSEHCRDMILHMFEMKRVPLSLLSEIKATHDFHALGYEEVKASMKPGVQLLPFDYYFEFVVDQCAKLEALRNM